MKVSSKDSMRSYSSIVLSGEDNKDADNKVTCNTVIQNAPRNETQMNTDHLTVEPLPINLQSSGINTKNKVKVTNTFLSNY